MAYNTERKWLRLTSTGKLSEYHTRALLSFKYEG